MKTEKLTLLEESLRKANQILKLIGLETDVGETNRSFLERLKNRKLFCFFTLHVYLEVTGEIAWFFDKGIIKGDFKEATYSLPCATLCILGSIKTYYSVKYGDHINELIRTLRELHAVDDESMRSESITYESIRKIIKNLDMSVKSLVILFVCGLIAFLFGPLFAMAYIYFQTGVLKLLLPFPIYYPFDPFDLKVYPFIYMHQMLGGPFAIAIVFGPDWFYFISCTYVQVGFCSLQHEMEIIISPNSNLRVKETRDVYQKKFVACVTRHSELIRCVELIEAIFSKSILFNFLASSILLCLAGFNIMASDNLVMTGNFILFLLMCLLQIYLLCYYGDNVSRSSVEVSYAIFKSQWYNVDPKVAKDLLMVMTRAQKPCKLTAYTFADIDLTAFSRVLSTSWSYFALLQSMYNRE